MKKALVLILALGSFNVLAADPRDSALLDSPEVKTVRQQLKQEQQLDCIFTYDEDGNLTVNYFHENNLKKFELFLDCQKPDGLNAVIKGVLGDGGETTVESVRMQTGVN